MAYNVALLALGAIVVAAAGLALLGPEAPLAVVAWLLSLGLAAGAVAVMRNARRAGHDDSHALRPTQPLSLSPSRTAVELEELERARIGELAEELGLGMPVSRVDLERRAAALLRGSECRYKLDSATGAFDEAEVGLEGAAEQLSRTLALQAAKTKEFAEWAAANGLGACLSPASALDVLAHIGDLRRDLAAVERIEPFLDETRARLDAFVDSVEHLPRIEGSHAAGQVHPISACTGGEDAATGAFGLACNRLVMVGAALERALDDATLRDGLARELQSNEESLRDVLGAGPEAARLNAELASGEVSAWQSEAAELSQSVKALEREEESLVRRHQSVYEAIGELTTSDRIVVLEQREQALESEMDETLRRFLVLGTARQLLQRTLTRHERERQPAVVAAAAERFRRVTGGRYTGLLADPGVQGGKTIRAVSATGEEIDAAHLSRGTVEQLYLCLRLGLADSFDARSISLPMVLDDVLVNFDPDRADAMASELVDTAGQRQILFLTCHPALAESMLEASASSGVASQLVELKQLS